MGCVSGVIKDGREAGEGVFTKMEVRGRALGCRAGEWDAGHGGGWLPRRHDGHAGLVCVPCLRLEPQAADFGIPLETDSLIFAVFWSQE